MREAGRKLLFRLPGLSNPGKNRRRNRRTIPKFGTRVLVVDDSRTFRFALSRMLRQAGYEVLEAENGREAVEVARAMRPQLVLMDVVMPEVNGYAATRMLRRAPETATTPIVIMSGAEEAIEQFWVIRIGADDFMPKPFSRFELFKRVEWFIHGNNIS